MKLLDFYRDIVTSIGLIVTDDGFIKVDTGDGNSINIMANGKPLVLPIKEQINTMTTVIDGKVVTNKVLFNPLKEDIVKGESASLKRLNKIIDIRLAELYFTTVELLLLVASDKDLQKKSSLKVMTIIGKLKGAKTQNVTNIVDAGSIEKWGKIVDETLKAQATKGTLHMYSKKAGKIDNVTYNRVAILTAPLKKIIDGMDAKEPLLGVKVRKKDLNVFKLLYDALLPNINMGDIYSFGSNDENSPGLISSYRLYSKIGKELLAIIRELGFIDDAVSEKYDYEIKDLSGILDNVSIFNAELTMIPNDVDSNRGKAAMVIENSVEANVDNQVNRKTTVQDILNKTTGINNNNNLPIVHNQMSSNANNVFPQQQPIIQQPVQQQVANDGVAMTAAQKILYGNTNPVQNNQMPQQQMNMQMQQPMQNMQMMPQQQMGMPMQGYPYR